MFDKKDSLRRLGARVGVGLHSVGVLCFCFMIMCAIAPFAYIAVVWVLFVAICIATLGLALFAQDQFFDSAYGFDLSGFAVLVYVLAIAAFVCFLSSVFLMALDQDFKPARNIKGSIVACVFCIAAIVLMPFIL